ncbi:MAG: hypothetical protein ABIR66_11490 [Saprospiraceae bacterium]
MKILIVTYTYPPAKSVNGFRPYYFAKALVQQGYDVQVLSRHFTGIEKFNEYNDINLTPFSISREDGILVFRTPFENTWFNYHRISWIKNSGLWKIIYLIQLSLGRTTQESYNKWFKPYLNKILLENKIDLILVESGPTNLVRIVSRHAIYFQIPYSIDFRDVYYHDMLKRDSLKLSKRIKISLEKWYMKKCINSAFYIFGESDSKLHALGVPISKSMVINNGYDESLWEFEQVINRKNNFVILIAGTVYDQPFLKTFLKALHIFLNFNLADVIIRFIAPGSSGIIEKIQNELGSAKVDIIPDRLSYVDTIHQIRSAQVLAYHGWSGYTGVFSSKIYDYIRSGNKILIIPSDGDVIEKLLADTKSDQAFDDPQKAADQLMQYYEIWMEGGNLAQAPDLNEIQKYSRQAQNKIFGNKISALLNEASLGLR